MKTQNKTVMLIYNEKISVSPITTHIPLKDVNKKISKNKIIYHVKSINSFYYLFIWWKCRVMPLPTGLKFRFKVEVEATNCADSNARDDEQIGGLVHAGEEGAEEA